MSQTEVFENADKDNVLIDEAAVSIGVVEEVMAHGVVPLYANQLVDVDV